MSSKTVFALIGCTFLVMCALYIYLSGLISGGTTDNADPEISNALAKVLRNEQHAGVRIRALETLNTMPAADNTRDALIEALRSDPNPAVRIKAVDALAKLAGSGATLDSAAVDMLRQKASQGRSIVGRERRVIDPEVVRQKHDGDGRGC